MLFLRSARNISAFAMLVMLLSTTTLCFAQGGDKLISISANNIPAREVFKNIEKETGYKFAMDKGANYLSERVDISQQKIYLTDVLAYILKGTGYSFKIDGETIFITQIDNPSTNATIINRNTTSTMTGRVLDYNTNIPIASAEVSLLSNPSIKTKTDREGRFLLQNVPVGTQTLTTTLKGYRTDFLGINVDTQNQTTVNVLLYSDRASRAQTTHPNTTSTKQTSTVTTSTNYNQGVENQTIQYVTATDFEQSQNTPATGNTPIMAIKTNLLYLTTTTPNLGLDFALSDHLSLGVLGGYNPSNRILDGAKIGHWSAQIELRYWFTQTFRRHSLGIHGIYADFEVGEISFVHFLKDKVVKGNMYGGGLTYTYSAPIGRKWRLEFSTGIGFIYQEYDKLMPIGNTGELEKEGRYQRTYFGPTKAAISICHLIF